jgi:hypothetical protein
LKTSVRCQCRKIEKVSSLSRWQCDPLFSRHCSATPRTKAAENAWAGCHSGKREPISRLPLIYFEMNPPLSPFVEEPLEIQGRRITKQYAVRLMKAVLPRTSSCDST